MRPIDVLDPHGNGDLGNRYSQDHRQISTRAECVQIPEPSEVNHDQAGLVSDGLPRPDPFRESPRGYQEPAFPPAPCSRSDEPDELIVPVSRIGADRSWAPLGTARETWPQHGSSMAKVLPFPSSD
jgi:hypothetical protein